METLIVICFMIVIALLIHDKIDYKKKQEHQVKQKKTNPNLPDIMGQPKAIRSLYLPNTANENQTNEHEINPEDLEIEYDENEEDDIQIPQKKLDEVFNKMPDLQEEEEEWNRYGISSADNRLAQGASYDELSTVGKLLQNDNLEPSQKETAVALVQKLQGTELFIMLENSIEGASQKIAQLLDSTLSSETKTASSTLRKNDLDAFDIGEFV